MNLKQFKGHSRGKWEAFVCDDGGMWSGYPIAITAPGINDSKSVVRQGGFYPYEWDEQISITEANCNANLIAAAPEILSYARSLEKQVNQLKRQLAALK